MMAEQEREEERRGGGGNEVDKAGESKREKDRERGK